MTQLKWDRSLEAWVAADEGGSSGPPGGAQAPVADDTCDLSEIFGRTTCPRCAHSKPWYFLFCGRCVTETEAARGRRSQCEKTHVGGNGAPLDTSEAEWERRYRELETVHAIFASSVRKALKIKSPVQLSTILDVVIAVKRNSDAYMESQYGHIWNKNKPPKLASVSLTDRGRAQ